MAEAVRDKAMPQAHADADAAAARAKGGSNLPVRTLFLGGWALRAAARAICDAARAWSITPHVYRRSLYDRAEDGGWRLRYRRRFRFREVLRLKLTVAFEVLLASLRLGVTRDILITQYREEGLLANLLHVLEVIRRLRPDARVQVDWTLTGAESAFRYGQKGHDVWTRLFKPVGTPLGKTAYHAMARVDWAFWGKGKDHLVGRQLRRQRERYHATVLEWLDITNGRVLAQVDEICTRHFHGRFCIGVHRRVGNVVVADLQRDGSVPSVQSVIATVQSIIAVATQEGTPDYAVYLATDDAEAVGFFESTFGSQLIVRKEVQRTTADAPEVHAGDWGRLSITDAEDALIDTVLLSQCNVMVHMSSSVSTVASLLNPALILVHA